MFNRLISGCKHSTIIIAGAISICISSNSAIAQIDSSLSSKISQFPITVSWATSFSEPDTSQNGRPGISDIHTLPDGRVAVVGHYWGVADFDYDGIIDLENIGGTDGYILLFDQKGHLDWARRIGGTAPTVPFAHFERWPTDSAFKVTSDAQKYIYVAGTFKLSADFDSDGIDDLHVTPPDTSASFIAKYDPLGGLLWAIKPNLPGIGIRDLVFDGHNDLLYVTGQTYQDSLSTLYLASISLQGTIGWDMQTPAPDQGHDQLSHISPYTLQIDSNGSIYIAGNIQGTVDFDGPGGIDPLITNINSWGLSAYQAFVAKYSSTGTLEWVRAAQGDSDSSYRQLIATNENTLILHGDFDRGSFEIVTPDSVYKVDDSGTSNLILAGYSTEGDPSWLYAPQHPSQQAYRMFIRGNDMIRSRDGAVIITGLFTDEVDLDLDGTADIISSEGFGTFIASYSSDGTFQKVLPFDEGNHWFISEDDNGHVYLAGSFDNTIDFDGPGGYPPLQTYSPDIFENYLVRLHLEDQFLPVQLTSFTATTDGADAILTWQTASETNNAGFEIQRAETSAAVRPIHESAQPSAQHTAQPQHQSDWQRIAFIEGAGTTTNPQAYAYRARTLTPGTHHFRLKQIDFDGTFEYSEETTVIIGLNTPYLLTSAFPNPFNPQTNFSLSIATSQHVIIDLYDILGRLVQPVFKGDIPASSTQHFSIDGSRLSSGTYLIRAQGELFSASQHIVLLK